MPETSRLVGVKIIEDVKHERTHRVLLDRRALKQAISEWVESKLGIAASGAGVSVNIHFETETEGSPAYSVGTCAEVCIIRDLRTVNPAEAVAVQA
ncbi:MAG TPA: hypothetical protein VIG90_15510 [Pedomonas sp.]|uniref:hypothetical protein n=1 Tax=Pedomonas sp. TaxID=2976421 RepID=UPI002F3E1F34